MSFKNAFKLMLSKFGYVWVILLYVLIMLLVVVSLGLTFLKPVFAAITQAGIPDAFNGVLLGLLNGNSIETAAEQLRTVVSETGKVLKSDTEAFWGSMLFVVLVMTFLYRFIAGMMELPLVSVIQGVMSDNAKYGFTGKFVSLIGKSSRFSLVKMVVLTAYDTVLTLIVLTLANLTMSVSVIFMLFVLMLSFVLGNAFRYALITAWSPFVTVEGKGIFPSLALSVKFAFRYFAPLFSDWIITWIIIIALNLFVGVFTFFAGLIVTVPMSVFFVSLLSMTFFYGRTGRSYYLDGSVFVPEQAKKREVNQ